MVSKHCAFEKLRALWDDRSIKVYEDGEVALYVSWDLIIR